MCLLTLRSSGTAQKRAALSYTLAQIEALNDGDGARFAFAAVLGWVLPALIVSASWLFHALILPRINRQCSNIAFEAEAVTRPRVLMVPCMVVRHVRSLAAVSFFATESCAS